VLARHRQERAAPQIARNVDDRVTVPLAERNVHAFPRSILSRASLELRERFAHGLKRDESPLVTLPAQPPSELTDAGSRIQHHVHIRRPNYLDPFASDKVPSVIPYQLEADSTEEAMNDGVHKNSESC
jgi:hypothetical protein